MEALLKMNNFYILVYLPTVRGPVLIGLNIIKFSLTLQLANPKYYKQSCIVY